MKSLQDPVSKLRGVGPKTVDNLKTLGIETVEDLLTYFPARHDDQPLTEMLAVFGDNQSETSSVRIPQYHGP